MTTTRTTDASGTHGYNGKKRPQGHLRSRQKRRKWIKINTNQSFLFVRIREVVGSNPIRSTIRSTVILIGLRWIFLLLLSDVPVGTAVFTERKWRSLRPASWCRSPQPGKYRRILLLPSAKPPEAVRHRAHRLRRLFLCKPYSAAFRLLSHFQLRTSGRSTPLSRIY